MKRNKFGMSHKVKGSMDFGLRYPVLVQEMVPGDILRVRPEAIVKSAIPPVTALTDKIYWKMESYLTADRLLDDHFVANLSTTKTGEVKGNFKTWSFDQIEQEFGSKLKGYTDPTRGKIIQFPKGWKFKPVDGVAQPGQVLYDGTLRSTFSPDDSKIPTNFSEVLPTAFKNKSSTSDEHFYKCSSWFGQGSLLDWLGLEPNGNVGDVPLEFRTNAISAYYMINNFYNTNPEYEKYIAPHFDYVYPGRDNSENRETLHRYETLRDEFGNEFEEPHLCGRCVNGLVVDNWHNDYFCNTTRDPQRGIAPSVPVSVSGSMPVSFLRNGIVQQSSNIGNFHGYLLSGNGSNFTNQAFANSDGKIFDEYLNSNVSPISGSFTISDLRTALALQHFQEDIQGTFKWTSFLQRVFGISPSDTLSDQPIFKGACSGVLSSSEVLQTVETADGSLGDIGGHLSGYGSGKMITVKASEHSIFMVIMTIKVERNYESGVERQFTRKNYLDMYFPQFVGIGNQAIRADELFACWNSSTRDKNIAFTDRYGEMKHKYNRVVGKCRNSNMAVRSINSANYSSLRPYTVSSLHSNVDFTCPYLNDFHPYAIGDSYVTGFTESDLQFNGLNFLSVNQDFLLCIPQLNDIFVSDTEEPFMVVIGFNMDMFRPLPVYTKPGISYV